MLIGLSLLGRHSGRLGTGETVTSLVARTPGVMFQFEIEVCDLSLFPYRARFWWRRVYCLWPYSGLNRPERKGRCLALVTLCSSCFGTTRKQGEKKCCPFAQRMNRGCSSSSCSQMQSGWGFSMDGYRTVVFRRHVASRVCRSCTRSTGPNLSITCRLIHPQYR